MLDQLSSPVGLPDTLVLRLHDRGSNDASQAEVVRVTARRCVIGTDETCNLRIQTPGARPVDCLILRGEEHVIVRRWSQQGSLNGAEFSDAVVQPGDRFCVGNTEFEVLDNTADAQAAAGEVREICDEPSASIAFTALRRGDVEARLRERNELNRIRAKGLIAEVRSCRQQIQDLAARLAETESDRNTSEPEEIRFEAVSSEPPVCTSALLSRLGLALPEEEEQTEEPRSGAMFHSPSSVGSARANDHGDQEDSAERTPPEQAGPGGEESIEDYMAQLLRRVTNKAAKASPAYEPGAPSPSSSGAQRMEVAPAEPEKPALLTELPTRSDSAQSRPANFSEMRALAHLHTRSLLDTHVRRSFLRSTVGQAIVVVVALIAGCGFLWLSRAIPILFFASIVSFAVAIVWGVQHATALRHFFSGKLIPGQSGVLQPGEIHQHAIEPQRPAPPQNLQPRTVVARDEGAEPETETTAE